MSIQFKSLFAFVFLVSLTISKTTFAQTEPGIFTAKNAIYLELGGSSGRYAVNYSKIFHQKGKLKLNASAGFSMWRDQLNDFKTIWLPVIPLEVSALYGKSNHHLELGMGVTSYLGRTLERISGTFELREILVYDAFIPLRVGYRYQKPEVGFFFRVGYTPIIILPTGGREGWIFEPRFAGVSFGKSF